eukprot:Colp12_sorted_trinity150504_noHs@28250
MGCGASKKTAPATETVVEKKDSLQDPSHDSVHTAHTKKEGANDTQKKDANKKPPQVDKLAPVKTLEFSSDEEDDMPTKKKSSAKQKPTPVAITQPLPKAETPSNGTVNTHEEKTERKTSAVKKKEDAETDSALLEADDLLKALNEEEEKPNKALDDDDDYVSQPKGFDMNKFKEANKKGKKITEDIFKEQGYRDYIPPEDLEELNKDKKPAVSSPPAISSPPTKHLAVTRPVAPQPVSSGPRTIVVAAADSPLPSPPSERRAEKQEKKKGGMGDDDEALMDRILADIE